VQIRSFNSLYNALVSVFLRKLEYYRGIIFLTTNRIKDIDDAFQNRISVVIRYEPLGLNTRKILWGAFLKRAATANSLAKYTPKNLDWLARKELNGRQVRY
jgi:hypothetical protein